MIMTEPMTVCPIHAGTGEPSLLFRDQNVFGDQRAQNPDEPTITLCRTYGVPMMAGALTPTEVVRAWRAGSDMVKVFPCGAVGGASYLKALRGPLPQVPLVPTGGVNLANAAELIRAGRKVYFCTCSLLVQELLVAKRDLKLSKALKRLAAFDGLRPGLGVARGRQGLPGREVEAPGRGISEVRRTD